MAMPTIFLKLVFGKQTLQGEAVVVGFEKLIVIDSINWNATATHPKTDDESNTTWSSQSVTLSKVFDSASAALYTKMKERKPFDVAEITVVDFNRVNGSPLKMMVLELEKGHVESVSTKASDVGLSMRINEDLTLSFNSGKLTYFPTAPNGGRSAATDFILPPRIEGNK